MFIFLYFLVHITGYKSVDKQTKGSEKVFYDFKKICNRGEVRYRLALARLKLPGFTVTDDFAAAVCSLPGKYDQKRYFYFIERWGTVSVLSLNFTCNRITTFYLTITRDFHVFQEVKM